jgi:hypothetical protein
MSILWWIVAGAALAGFIVMMVVGLVKDFVWGRPARDSLQSILEAGEKSVTKVGDDLAGAAKTTGDAKTDGETLQAQSASLDTMGSALEGLAKFTAALKEVDPGTRAYLIAVVFLILAVISAAIGQIASASATPNCPPVSTDSGRRAGGNLATSMPQSAAQTYTVRPGDNLWNLSCAFYGDASKYMKIVRANKIVNPDRIWPAQILTIPDD